MYKHSLFLSVGCGLVLAMGCSAGEQQNAQGLDESVGVAESAVVYSGFQGCRGNPSLSCDELVDPVYYRNHTSCIRNLACNGVYYPCGAECPIPTTAEKPTLVVKAGGTATPLANIIAGYVWSGGPTGGFYSNTLAGNSVPDPWKWAELQLGIGVYAESYRLASAYCDVGSTAPPRVVRQIVARRTDGTVVGTYPCGSTGCWAQSVVSVGTGIVFTCEFGNS